MNFGLNLSAIDGTEILYSAGSQTSLPDRISFRKFMPSAEDQGAQPLCVPYAISAVVEHYLQGLGVKGPRVDKDAIYAVRSVKNAQGMSFKEALNYLVSSGCPYSAGSLPIRGYCLLGTKEAMRSYFCGFGPFVIGVPVHDSTVTEFWKGRQLEGFHALAVTGYSQEGLEIRNSWGVSYGSGGYATLPWEDLHFVREAWGIRI